MEHSLFENALEEEEDVLTGFLFVWLAQMLSILRSKGFSGSTTVSAWNRDTDLVQAFLDEGYEPQDLVQISEVGGELTITFTQQFEQFSDRYYEESD